MLKIANVSGVFSKLIIVRYRSFVVTATTYLITMNDRETIAAFMKKTTPFDQPLFREAR